MIWEFIAQVYLLGIVMALLIPAIVLMFEPKTTENIRVVFSIMLLSIVWPVLIVPAFYTKKPRGKHVK